MADVVLADPLVVAVDWSGASGTGSTEKIWIATASSGRLRTLENGFTREEAIGRIVALGADHPRMLVGLDFAFAFPRWFADASGWRGPEDAWQAAKHDGDAWLAEQPPFWGRTRPRGVPAGDRLRVTEARSSGSKSVFQVGGAGAVGTGSIRGMPFLLTLQAAGFAIWPFDPPGARTVVEIYPRALTAVLAPGARIVKTRHRSRLAVLAERCPEQDPVLRERAAGSDDAFDAAVSAIVMSRHAARTPLPDLSSRPVERGEGWIWEPSGAGSGP